MRKRKPTFLVDAKAPILRSVVIPGTRTISTRVESGGTKFSVGSKILLPGVQVELGRGFRVAGHLVRLSHE